MASKVHKTQAARGSFKVKTVTFRSSIQIKDFQHAHVELTADVPAGWSVSETLDQLKVMVADELKATKEGRVAPIEVTGRFRT